MHEKRKSRLLVSVRSVEEAAAAFAGGADLIDVKEPRNGSLGRASAHVVHSIVDFIAGRCPVSAAMGELVQENGCLDETPNGLAYLKWGLAGVREPINWRQSLTEFAAQLHQTGGSAQIVAVAYADWQLAAAPPVHEVAAFVCNRPGNVMLVDTWDKSPGQGLLDWLSPAELGDLCQRCRSAHVRIALAGSLGAADIVSLQESNPDWFAVRGAVCSEGRDSTVVKEKVRALKELLD